MCKAGSVFVGLIKPQFECRRGETVNGVVEDESIRLRCIEEVKVAYSKAGFVNAKIKQSPITGPAGNVEFLIYTIKEV